MLRIWTSAEQDNIQKALQPAFNSFKVVPPHEFIPWEIHQVVLPKSGEVVLALGTTVLEELKRHGNFPKNRTLTSLRGKPVEFASLFNPPGWLLPSFDPFIALVEPEKAGLLHWDIRLADRIYRTGTPTPEIGEYGYVKSLQGVRAYVNWKYQENLNAGLSGMGARITVCLDLETMGLIPWEKDKGLVSLQVSVEPGGVADVVYLLDDFSVDEGTVLLDDVEWLLNSEKIKIVGSNLKFDLLWIRVKWGLLCTNFFFDNLLAGSLVDENRSNSLNFHAKVYTEMGGYDDVFNDTHDKAHMEDVPQDELLPYAGGDSDAGVQVSSEIKREILYDNVTTSGAPARCSLANLYATILHPAARAFERIEFNGVVADVQAFKDFGDELTIEISDSFKAMAHRHISDRVAWVGELIACLCA